MPIYSMPLPDPAARHLITNRHQSLEDTRIIPRLNTPLEALRPHVLVGQVREERHVHLADSSISGQRAIGEVSPDGLGSAKRGHGQGSMLSPIG